ncbi:hypothetical protein BGZ99_010184 [Dissophora globulifera]|uniref:Uncharacterized protein n=1 Tax=Dissophora globulifera TaxID=979702 RepID=A0A9P6R538_9FUNG|nr:hypothetical protein BGZ99_010184 [Dissophora globulifera]
MNTPTKEEIGATISNAPSEKASGASGVTEDLVKCLGPLARAIFIILFKASIVQGRLPKVWLNGLICCIQKASVVLKGTLTKDPIHILNSVMEDAREFNKEVWIMF